MSDIKYCECCGAKMMKYRHSFSAGVISALIKLSNAQDYTAHLEDDLKLTHKQICNIQKLKYWGLIHKTEKAGVWKMTYKGVQFVNGEIEIPNVAWSYRNEPIDPPFDKVATLKMVNINSYMPKTYEKREDYIDNAVPDGHMPKDTMELLGDVFISQEARS